MEFLLTQVGEELETGVALGVFEVDGFFPFGHESDQAFTRLEAGDPYLLRVEALSGLEHEVAGIRVPHVHAAHFGAHGIAYPLDDDIEGFGQSFGGIDLLDNIAQGLKHGRLGSRLLFGMTPQG